MNNICLHEWTDFDSTGQCHCRQPGCGFVATKEAIVTATPTDYLSPNWASYEMAHCWRNHVSDRIRVMWDTFTADQKAAIALSAAELAYAKVWH